MRVISFLTTLAVASGFAPNHNVGRHATSLFMSDADAKSAGTVKW